FLGILTMSFPQSSPIPGILSQSTSPSTICWKIFLGSSRKSAIPSAKSSAVELSQLHARPAAPMIPPCSKRAANPPPAPPPPVVGTDLPVNGLCPANNIRSEERRVGQER